MTMDHSQMGHSMPGMDHGDEAMCKMNMIFTWDWHNLCVIFRWWHIRSFSGFLLSLVAISVLAALYEYLRARVKRLENKTKSIRLEEQPLESVTNDVLGSFDRLQRAVLYGVLVGYSYLMMLVFMTYNGWVMLSIVFGAGVGNYLFNGEFNDSLACH